jgi:hypothetical protein
MKMDLYSVSVMTPVEKQLHLPTDFSSRKRGTGSPKIRFGVVPAAVRGEAEERRL